MAFLLVPGIGFFIYVHGEAFFVELCPLEIFFNVRQGHFAPPWRATLVATATLLTTEALRPRLSKMAWSTEILIPQREVRS